MEKIGHTFRLLRVNKKITLAQASQGIVTIAFLSRFERGQSDISVSNLLLLLRRINVEIFEFVHINEFNNGINVSFEREVSDCYITKDIRGLDRLVDQVNNDLIEATSFKTLKIIMLTALIDDLTGKSLSKKQQQMVVSHLSSVNSWTAFEFYLFGNVLFMLPIEQVIVLTKLMIKPGLSFILLKNDNITTAFRILNNTVTYCCDEGAYDDGWFFLGMMKKLAGHPRQFYERMKVLSLEGLLAYYSRPRQIALDMIHKALQVCYLVGGQEVYQRERQAFVRVLEDDELKYVTNF
ncbi:HTH family transcriptional regulator rgg [Lactiplantibacillus plantarum]|uniref:Rgg family transcriptional regulator n=2 Tax=Lactiplantibacillus plantarum TaxID=1590 RepID=UPI000FB42725|nr:helix-turn-helix domain-containing protein [Lactiplantibacillus plantarum]MCH8625107.1 helix-turn-helix domain-containing protein [Lactiplantibacillus plantarum]MCH8630520.1 helix-turn-helix domain-containing protein [Lactiplantibacillus plantarum]MCH8633525.1 helix-turn-helix domain-containing protein [Lactiplantibacillus plantarum]NLS61402.1 helix-turn-helix domain-containing protein [Lactiplantibacillus plantarum]VDH10303.1 HTH family transcriptional regulator rgg [Lactiplantibacillus pl